MNPIGYWTGALPGTTDANILDHLQEQFGSRFEELNCDDKASLLICLVEAAVNPQQVMTEPNFYSDQNGGEAWLLAQQLSVGGALIGACVASTGGTIIALATDIFKKPSISNRELLAVLSSKDVKQWVKLWELSADTELFLSALEYACQGELIEINGREKFQHDDGKHPFDVAHNWILSGIETKPVADQLAIAPTQPQETVSDSRRDSSEHRTPPASPAPSTKWIDNFIRQTALIWGNQGSGKSWMARYIAKRKKDEGYRVVVLDPDSNRAEWEGVESYHDFEEIASFLGWYVDELKGRYKAFNASNMTEDAWRAKLWADGKAIAVLCEEVTTYVDLIEDKDLLIQFFRLGLTKSRKQEMPLTFVSHNNTQSALGGIKGLANLIEKMLQLELNTDIDPETLQPVASGKGAVKLDGSNQWVPVTLPKLEQKITKFGSAQPTLIQQPIPERVETNAATSDDIREKLEALIKATPKDKANPQSEMGKKLLYIIQSATKYPISFESIRKSRKWENASPDKATLLAALNELSFEWIRGSEEEGYYLQD